MTAPTPRPAPAHSRDVLTATDATFDDLVAASDVPVLVDFSAQWCPPCRAMPPILEAIAAEHGDRIRVITVDEEDAPELFVRERITGMPTFKVFEGGTVTRTIVGAQPRPALEGALGLR